MTTKLRLLASCFMSSGEENNARPIILKNRIAYKHNSKITYYSQIILQRKWLFLLGNCITENKNKVIQVIFYKTGRDFS